MSFHLFAQSVGVLVNDLSPSNRIRRCGTSTHPKSKNGAYMYDGRGGWVMSWETGELHVFGSDKEFTPSEKQAWAKSKREAEQKRDRAYELAAHKAAILLRDCSLTNHAYLQNKGFPDELGLVDSNGRLLIPMRDCLTDELRGIQAIAWHIEERKFSKKMMHGMKAKGAVIRIGLKRTTETFLVEGYATALSVHAALSQLHLKASVLCCFSDSNLVHVANQISGKKFIFADNDISRAGENAAIKTGLPYCMSETVGNDANDDHVEKGILHVCKKLIALRRNVVYD